MSDRALNDARVVTCPLCGTFIMKTDYTQSQQFCLRCGSMISIMVKKGRISTEVISEGNTDLVNEATKDMYAWFNDRFRIKASIDDRCL